MPLAHSASLCGTCAYAQLVRGRRGQVYLRCRNDLVAEKYPRQPLMACAHHQAFAPH